MEREEKLSSIQFLKKIDNLSMLEVIKSRSLADQASCLNIFILGCWVDRDVFVCSWKAVLKNDHARNLNSMFLLAIIPWGYVLVSQVLCICSQGFPQLLRKTDLYRQQLYANWVLWMLWLYRRRNKYIFLGKPKKKVLLRR